MDDGSAAKGVAGVWCRSSEEGGCVSCCRDGRYGRGEAHGFNVECLLVKTGPKLWYGSLCYGDDERRIMTNDEDEGMEWCVRYQMIMKIEVCFMIN